MASKKKASAPKKAPAIVKGSTESPKAAEAAPAKAADAAPSTDTASAKTESSEASGGAPKNYSRGEGQKPVTQAYIDNWNAIFGNDKKKKKKR